MAFILQKASNLVTENMERAFYRWVIYICKFSFFMISSHLNEMNQSVKSLAVTSSKQLKEKIMISLGPLKIISK